ncbi:alpha/beta fold hydrolase, partial [Nocardia cyriacigeorgica]|uniref:alpha/beta fold hydrolase n=1 Tax=Nocardia cyriacigeorgica TaxID=135487 RepID=UPI002811203C
MRWTRSVLVVVLTVALAGCVDSMTEGGDGGDNASARVTQLVAEADAAPTPQLNWGACGEPELDGYECAVAQVPLDYSRPAERTLPLAVVRRPAADPDHRIGTLFAGVGGPGGSGYDWARDTDILSGELARRFDVVTFDQRGIGRSSQVHCFADPAAQQQFWDDVALPPVNSDQQAAAAVAARELAAGCSEHSGDLLPHLTTVDAARDLDLLRRAMGEAQMNYIGYSYASYLGQVYGALFGDRLRATLEFDEQLRQGGPALLGVVEQGDVYQHHIAIAHRQCLGPRADNDRILLQPVQQCGSAVPHPLARECACAGCREFAQPGEFGEHFLGAGCGLAERSRTVVGVEIRSDHRAQLQRPHAIPEQCAVHLTQITGVGVADVVHLRLTHRPAQQVQVT